MKNLLLGIAMSVFAICIFSCNPNCNSLIGLEVFPAINPSGHQLLVTATPLESLEGRRVFFGDELAETTYIEGTGLLITVPAGELGRTELRIEDSDCVDFIVINFDRVSESFFIENQDFIAPIIPEIIIPNLPADFPPSIENAWLHPMVKDYCFWIKFLPDNNGSCTKYIDPQTSFEKSICEDETVLYASNPLSGRIESDGSVFVAINRYSGVEEFTGRLINPLEVPMKYRNWEPLDCDQILNTEFWASDFKNRDYMMLLTSKLTGRQLLIYQQNIPGVLPDCF